MSLEWSTWFLDGDSKIFFQLSSFWSILTMILSSTVANYWANIFINPRSFLFHFPRHFSHSSLTFFHYTFMIAWSQYTYSTSISGNKVTSRMNRIVTKSSHMIIRDRLDTKLAEPGTDSYSLLCVLKDILILNKSSQSYDIFSYYWNVY